MEARRGLPRRGPTVVGGIAAILLVVPGISHADEVWDSDVDGNSIAVGAEESSSTQQVGSSTAQDGQGNGGQAATGPVVQSRWVPDCLDSSPIDEVMCNSALLCPENNGSDDPGFVRMRLYQRQTDRKTGESLTDWQYVGTECLSPEEREAAATEQADGPSLFQLVLREWEQVQIPAATIGINPPDGRTLVNFETIFYTDTGEQTFPTTLLGRSVTIYAIPLDYTWHHGDGTTQTTDSPGAPYPSKQITHQFETIGTVTPRVDVRYRAEYTIDNSARQPIPGIATVTGTTEELTILQARTQLVDG